MFEPAYWIVIQAGSQSWWVGRYDKSIGSSWSFICIVVTWASNRWTACQFLILGSVNDGLSKAIEGVRDIMSFEKLCSSFWWNIRAFQWGFPSIGSSSGSLPVLPYYHYWNIQLAICTESKNQASKQERILFMARGYSNNSSPNAKSPDKFAAMLERLWLGSITGMDIARLQRWVLRHPAGPTIDDASWWNAILITPWNALRHAWNNQAMLQHCITENVALFVLPSVDEGIKCPRRNMVWTPDSKTAFLATWNTISIYAHAAVTGNITVEFGVAKGTEVIVREVVPDLLDTSAWAKVIQIPQPWIIKLRQPPICVWIEVGQESGFRRCQGVLSSRPTRLVSIIGYQRANEGAKGVWDGEGISEDTDSTDSCVRYVWL